MNSELRSFVGINITAGGRISLKRILNVEPDDFVYVLLKTNCIEIRTKAQQDALLEKVSKLIKLTNDDKYKKLHASIFAYSKSLRVGSKSQIYLGNDIVDRRKFDKNVIIEKCDDCIKLWHPKMFKVEMAEYNNKVSRSK